MLLLINGAPGVGKSTLADRDAEEGIVPDLARANEELLRDARARAVPVITADDGIDAAYRDPIDAPTRSSTTRA